MALSENDYKIVKKIYDSSLVIFNSYKKLIDLEKRGKKNTSGFQSVIHNLNSLLAVENNYYKELVTSKDKKDELLLYLFDDVDVSTIGEDISMAEGTNEEDLVNRRLALKIKCTYSDSVIKDYTEELLNILFIPESVVPPQLKTLVNKYLEQDLLNSISAMVSLYAEHDKNSNIKAELTNLKYNLSYLYPFIERENISNKFESVPLYWSKIMFCDMFQVDEEEVNMSMVEGMCEFFLNYIIKNIFKGNSYSLSEAEITFILIYFRTSLLFFNKEKIDELKNQFIMKVVHNNTKKDNVELQNKMLEIFENWLQDKNIPRLVRFNNFMQ